MSGSVVPCPACDGWGTWHNAGGLYEFPSCALCSGAGRLALPLAPPATWFGWELAAETGLVAPLEEIAAGRDESVVFSLAGP